MPLALTQEDFLVDKIIGFFIVIIDYFNSFFSCFLCIKKMGKFIFTYQRKNIQF